MGSIIRGLLAQAAAQAKGVGRTALGDVRAIDNGVGFLSGVRPSTVGLSWSDMLGLTHGHFAPGSARSREADNVGLLLSGDPAAGAADAASPDVARALLAKARIASQVSRNGVPAHAMGIVGDYAPFPVDRARSLGVSGPNIRTVAGLQRGQGVHATYELSQPVDSILGNIRAKTGGKVTVVDPGGRAWGDAVGGASGTGEFTRHPVLISPKGKVYVSSQPGFHHDDVAIAAGLPTNWPQKGYFQADLKAGVPELNVPPTMSIGGYAGGFAPPTRGHAYGIARLKNAIKGAGSSIVTSH